MKLYVLGTGVVQPALRRGSSAYAVEAGDDLLFFDLGSGGLRSALAAGLDPRRARHCFLSHVHPDHTADLVPFLFACNYAPGWKPREEIRFYGPEGTEEFLRALEVPWPWLAPKGWTRSVHPMAAGAVEGAAWRARSFPVEHGGLPSLAWRVESGGRSLCYSGDTGPCDGLLEAARGVDLLVAECSISEEHPPVEGHLTSGDVGRLARAAGVSRVLLTHLYPGSEALDVVGQVRRYFRGPVERAEDGATFTL